MIQTPKTIQIFLPGGNPQGIRVAEITTRILQVIEVPRSLLSDFAQMPESNQVATYFLFGESDDDDSRVYIGQTGDLSGRLAAHNREKDFWERALIVVSRTNSLTQTHGVFLEWYCIQACREAGRYLDENGNAGSKPYTPPPLEADCLEIFDTAKTLLATLGYPIFDPVAKTESTSNEDEIFFCKGSGADGRGQYTTEGFVVLKGSIGRIENVPSIVGTSLERTRAKLQTSGVFEIEDDQLVFKKDHLFGSPSMAAMALMGRTANGWVEWKDDTGRTLDELKRQQNEL
jgi:Domain of unknown function (DUF4357)